MATWKGIVGKGFSPGDFNDYFASINVSRLEASIRSTSQQCGWPNCRIGILHPVT